MNLKKNRIKKCIFTVFFILNDRGGANIYVVCMGYLCICGQLNYFVIFREILKVC